MPNNFQLAGAQSSKPVHFAPIFTNRFFQGLWTQRNPLRDAGSTRIEEKFYGTRGDAMIAGSNVEISNRLTPVRRPGNSVYNAASWTAVDYFYEFRLFTTTTETIKVMVDTSTVLYDGTGPSNHFLLWTKSTGAGQTFMQSVGNTLYFGNGVDTKKWMQPPAWVANNPYSIGDSLIDSNNHFQYLNRVDVGTITGGGGGGFSISAKIVTLQFDSGNFLLTPGMSFGCFGFTTGTYINGVRLFALTVNGSTVTAFFDHVNVAFTSDSTTEVFTTDVGVAGTSGAVAPVWAHPGTTKDHNLTWVTDDAAPAGLYNIGVVPPPQAPSINVATVTTNSWMTIWQPSTAYSSLPSPHANVILTTDNQVWFISQYGAAGATSGTSGPNYPTFTPPSPTATIADQVVDGTLTWQPYVWLGSTSTAFISFGPKSWTPLTSTTGTGGVQILCLDTNGNLQVTASSGTTGASAPAWNTTYNGNTTDASVTWTNIGPYLTRAFAGWQYGYAYHCVDGSVSTLSPLSPTTFGVIDGVIVSGLTSFTDTQVDSIWLFRTSDGGATPLYLASFPNPVGITGSWSFTDQLQDSLLDIFLIGPQAEQNNPPPAGLINLTYHLGRVFGSVGNVVYWSNGPDTLVGNGNTAFPPLNSATYPAVVTRIVPTAGGALVFTISDIYELIGQGTPSSPIISTPYAAGIGLLSYNALTVNGSLVYLFTADSQLISLDPSSGLSQVGFPIGDQLEMNNWNPATAYLAWHVSGSQDHALYVADGATGWFRMNPTAAPESGLVWSPFATIVGGVKAVQSIEVSPGVHRLLLGPVSTGQILKRDLTVYTDNGTTYPATFTIGSIVLAQPGQIAELVFATTDCPAVGSPPTLAVLMDEISGPFEGLDTFTADPPQLPPSQTLFAQRFYFSQTQEPAICRHLQIQTNWPSEASQNEMYSLTLFGSFIQEV